MTAKRYDVLVIGAGPSGSIAAVVLARGGARVALVDKASFPREKACGDLIGPRGVRVLEDLQLDDRFPGALRVGDMEVVGPNRRRVLLRAFEGVTYPGFGWAVPRRQFDASLRQAAIEAGADGLTGRADSPIRDQGDHIDGFRFEVDRGRYRDLMADVIIGADGAISRVATAAALVDNGRVLWGFAVRGYRVGAPPLPQISFWEPSRRTGYPGYGWMFPGPDDAANIGLGIGVKGDRRAGARATRDLNAFVSSLAEGPDAPNPLDQVLGGWLKLGMVGTKPVRGRTLLVGDAAGLVNPLQGEGISEALGSGRAAAEAILSVGPAHAAGVYCDELRRRYAPHASTTAPVTAWMLSRPLAVAGLSRLLTAPGMGRFIADGWGIYWNDLVRGAHPGRGRRMATVADGAARLLTARSRDRKDLLDGLACTIQGRD